MRVKEAMRPAWGLDPEATLDDFVEAVQATGCETLPVVGNPLAGLVVRQLVSVRDLPKLKQVESSAQRGHALGGTVLELLSVLGRAPGRFPTIDPSATLVDAWGLMSDEGVAHLPVTENSHIIGMLSLFVTFSEFPHRSPAAGFWAY
jgi:CBS domain-containing protein